MRSSTLKGLVCHTADDDNSIIGPDPFFGWGLLNAKKAAETITKVASNQAIIYEGSINDGQSYTFNFFNSGTSKIIATICWTDPAGTSKDGVLNSTASVLVNDLDIRLVNGATTHFPWKLDVSNASNPAIKGDNVVDNVEKIEIINPVSGTYTVTVNHKGSLTNGSQQFALILTGNDITLDNDQYTLNEFKIWPNPSKDVLNISFKPFRNMFKVNLYDVQGRIVFSETIPDRYNEVYTLSTTQYSKGIYLLNISSGNQILNKTIVIE
jgi:hypothetical protein